jgi:hypothetical protein
VDSAHKSITNTENLLG